MRRDGARVNLLIQGFIGRRRSGLVMAMETGVSEHVPSLLHAVVEEIALLSNTNDTSRSNVGNDKYQDKRGFIFLASPTSRLSESRLHYPISCLFIVGIKR